MSWSGNERLSSARKARSDQLRVSGLRVSGLRVSELSVSGLRVSGLIDVLQLHELFNEIHGDAEEPVQHRDGR